MPQQRRLHENIFYASSMFFIPLQTVDKNKIFYFTYIFFYFYFYSKRKYFQKTWPFFWANCGEGLEIWRVSFEKCSSRHHFQVFCFPIRKRWVVIPQLNDKFSPQIDPSFFFQIAFGFKQINFRQNKNTTLISHFFIF